jgi:hypothetical protein
MGPMDTRLLHEFDPCAAKHHSREGVPKGRRDPFNREILCVVFDILSDKPLLKTVDLIYKEWMYRDSDRCRYE